MTIFLEDGLHAQLHTLACNNKTASEYDQEMPQSQTMTNHSGKSATIRESNHGSGVCKELYA